MYVLSWRTEMCLREPAERSLHSLTMLDGGLPTSVSFIPSPFPFTPFIPCPFPSTSTSLILRYYHQHFTPSSSSHIPCCSKALTGTFRFHCIPSPTIIRSHCHTGTIPHQLLQWQDTIPVSYTSTLLKDPYTATAGWRIVSQRKLYSFYGELMW